MKKINILKENREFNRIIQNIKPFYFNEYVLYIEKNKDMTYKFGFSVGKKIGNAVTRNKIKRQLKNIVRENYYSNGFICIIMVRKSILDKSFNEKKEILNKALKKTKLLKEIKNE